MIMLEDNVEPESSGILNKEDYGNEDENIVHSSSTNHNTSFCQMLTDENTSSDILLENDKLRKQNLKLQKILAIAGVHIDKDYGDTSPPNSSLQTTQPAACFQNLKNTQNFILPSDHYCITVPISYQTIETHHALNNSIISNFGNNKLSKKDPTLNVNVSSSGNYHDANAIVDISPPLPTISATIIANKPLISSATEILNTKTNFCHSQQQIQPNDIKSWTNEFNYVDQINQSSSSSKLFMNQFGQQVAIIPPTQQQNSHLNQSTNNSSVYNSAQSITEGLIQNNIQHQLVTSQSTLLGTNNNLIFQNNQGFLFQQPTGILTQNPNNTFTILPQATPLFNPASTLRPLAVNIIQPNINKDFLMLPNGKLVPISTQPSFFPNNFVNTNQVSQAACVNFIGGVGNQLKLQIASPQTITSLQNVSRSNNLVQNQLHLINSQNQLNANSPILLNRFPLNTNGLCHNTSFQLGNSQSILPIPFQSSNLFSSSSIPSQRNITNNQGLTAYLTSEGTLILSLQTPTGKKEEDLIQKVLSSSASSMNNEKKTHRKIMPKPMNDCISSNFSSRYSLQSSKTNDLLSTTSLLSIAPHQTLGLSSIVNPSTLDIVSCALHSSLLNESTDLNTKFIFDTIDTPQLHKSTSIFKSPSIKKKKCFTKKKKVPTATLR